MAGLLPAAIQAAREWCPSRMRPFAIGLALATGQVVAAGAPRLEAWLLLATGWRTVLLLTGLPSAASLRTAKAAIAGMVAHLPTHEEFLRGTPKA